MKIALFSSTLNHHQLPLCLEIEKLIGKDNFTFVSSIPLTDERRNLGFPDLNDQYDFVLKSYENDDQLKNAYEVALNSDVVIFGVAPESFVRARIRKNKLTFRYQERIFKRTRVHILRPWTFMHILWNHSRYFNKKLYMLCASGYTAGDYRLGGAYNSKCFKWGYFPKTENTNINDILIEKSNKKVRILWVGRFLEWKHPEYAVHTAEYLAKKGYDFQVNIIGAGPLENRIDRLIHDKGLNNYVNLLGSMASDEVRNYMRKSEIFIFTSNREEGWGVVLNEAMNSGCAVVANQHIGSVPYLIKNGYNGFTYNNSLKELCTKVEILINDEKLRNDFSTKANETITKEWNPENAAKKLLLLIENLITRSKRDIFSTGVLSIDKGKL